MAIAEGKLALEAGTAGLTLLSSLISLMQTARKEGKDVGLAEIMAKLPGQTFELSKDLIRETQKIKQDFLDASIPLDKSIDELQSDYGWWRFGKHKLLRRFESRSNAIANDLGHFLDDFLAVANCTGTEELVALSFSNAKGRQHEIDSINRREAYVGDVFDQMIGHAGHLRDEVQSLI